MTITRPESMNPDPELYSQFSGQSRELLNRLFNEFRDPDEHRRYDAAAFTADEWRTILASEYPEEARRFVHAYQRLRDESVRTSPIMEHLGSNYEIDSDRLNITSLYEVVVLLLEENLLNRLDEFIVAAKFRPSAVTGTYVLDTELDLEGLDEQIEEFHQEHADKIEAENKKGKRLDVEFQAENIVAVRFHRESSMDKARYFSGENEDDLGKPSIEKFSYRKLKHIRFLVSVRDGETQLIFTKNLGGWNRALNSVFYNLFGISEVTSQLEHPGSTVAKDVEEAAAESVEDDTDPIDQIQGYIDDRCDVAKEEVNDLGIPDQKEQELKQLLETIHITGTEVDEDQSISAREFRIISETSLADLFASVDIEKGFKDVLRKADQEKLGFVLDVDGVPVECQNGMWKRAGSGMLPDDVRQALQVFFNEESPI